MHRVHRLFVRPSESPQRVVFLLLSLLLSCGGGDDGDRCQGNPGQGSLIYYGSVEGVSVVDAGSESVRAFFPLGRSGVLGISSDGRLLGAGDFLAESFEVAIISTADGEVLDRFELRGHVIGIAFQANDSRLWVSHVEDCLNEVCSGESGITVFDLESGAEVAFLQEIRSRVAFNATQTVAYAVDENMIRAIDTSTFETIATRSSICCISSTPETHPDGNTVYVRGREFGAFVATTDFGVPSTPARPTFLLEQGISTTVYDLAFSIADSRAYLPGVRRSEDPPFIPVLFVLDTSDSLNPRLISIAELETIAAEAAVTLDGARVYLSSERGLFAFDPEKNAIVAELDVPPAPSDLVVGPDLAEAPRPCQD